jgi:hypothetical protein
MNERQALKEAMRVMGQAHGNHEALANVRREAAKVIDGIIANLPNAEEVMDEIDAELEIEEV